MHPTLRRATVAPTLLAVALGVAACGSSNSGTTASTSTTAAAASPATVVGKSASVVLNPVTAQSLKAAGITITPIAPATAKTGVLVFPVSGGHMVVTTLSGTVEEKGGVTLSHEGRSIQLSDFTVDTTTKQITSSVGGQSVPIFDMDLASIKRASGPNGTALASNISLTLTAEAADALNGSLGVTFLKEGLPFGIATLTIAIKP